MTSSTRRPARIKAVLAIAFAGNMLAAQLPALSQAPRLASASMIDFISKNSRMSREEKAYYLLQLANSYTLGSDSTSWEVSLRANLSKQSNIRSFDLLLGREDRLLSWADQVSLQSRCGEGETQSATASKKICRQNLALADKSIEAAMARLDQGPKGAQVLNMYLIACRLSQVTGNTENERKCAKVLNDAIRACEANKGVDSVQIKMVSSILNSMAYGLLPIEIVNYKTQTPGRLPALDMKNFNASERLKLRASALLDRLPAADHDRRKAHRDMTFWYLQLGKGEKARREKQELFTLVGVKDESILYAQPGWCGAPVWWSVQKVTTRAYCGMG